jgi:hypothetical protein
MGSKETPGEPSWQDWLRLCEALSQRHECMQTKREVLKRETVIERLACAALSGQCETYGARWAISALGMVRMLVPWRGGGEARCGYLGPCRPSVT